MRAGKVTTGKAKSPFIEVPYSHEYYTHTHNPSPLPPPTTTAHPFPYLLRGGILVSSASRKKKNFPKVVAL